MEILNFKRASRFHAFTGDEAQDRQDEWTGSIAVGSRSFIEKLKALLGLRAKGRKVSEGGKGYQLREGAAHYKAPFGAPFL